jgi:hypothetical protein
MKEYGICGTLCDDCSLFLRECKGCASEMRDGSYRCQVFSCASSRGIDSCSECTEDMTSCSISREHRKFCPLIVSKTNRFELNL